MSKILREEDIKCPKCGSNSVPGDHMGAERPSYRLVLIYWSVQRAQFKCIVCGKEWLVGAL